MAARHHGHVPGKETNADSATTNKVTTEGTTTASPARENASPAELKHRNHVIWKKAMGAPETVHEPLFSLLRAMRRALAEYS